MVTGLMSWQSPDGRFSENRVCLPKRLGEGYVRSIKFNNNMHLMIADQRFTDDLRIEAPPEDWPLEFIFSFGGSVQSTIEGIGETGCLDSHAAVLYMPGKKARMDIARARRNQSVSIKLDPQYVQSWLADDSSITASILHALEHKTPVMHGRPLMAAQQVALFQLLQCSLSGSASRMYLESKALELIALSLDSFAEPLNPSPTLRDTDIRKIHLARDIVLQNAVNPPGLQELAHRVGTNEFKLKSGFKAVFGTTVFGYVRKQRMEQARMMLVQGDVSVTQVALEVGYASLGHFVEAFKTHFGITPGRLLTQSRKNRVATMLK